MWHNWDFLIMKIVRLNFRGKPFHLLDFLPVFPISRVYFSNIISLAVAFPRFYPPTNSHQHFPVLETSLFSCHFLSFTCPAKGCHFASTECPHPFKKIKTKSQQNSWPVPAACLAWSAAGTGAAGPWWGCLLCGKAVLFLVSAAPPHSCRHPAANGDCRSPL